MICKYCGQNVNDGTRFCNNCGAELSGGAPQQSSQQQFGQGQPGYPQPQEYRGSISMDPFPKKKKNPVTAILTAVVIIGLVIALIVHFTSDVGRVKNGCPVAYPNTTWGDALDKVCKKGKWKSERKDGDRYVKYTGKIKSSGEKIEITFKVKDSKNFTVEKIKKGGQEYSNSSLMMASIIRDIFENDL